jgi:hypothetical protein
MITPFSRLSIEDRIPDHSAFSQARNERSAIASRLFQLNYVPVVVIFFAYCALDLIDFTRDLWIKESLSFTPSQLAGIGVGSHCLAVKMVFGDLVDTVPMFGSGRNTARSARSGLLTMSSMPLTITGRPRHRPRCNSARGCARRERPCGSGAAEERDEIAPWRIESRT